MKNIWLSEPLPYIIVFFAPAFARQGIPWGRVVVALLIVRWVWEAKKETSEPPVRHAVLWRPLQVLHHLGQPTLQHGDCHQRDRTHREQHTADLSDLTQTQTNKWVHHSKASTHEYTYTQIPLELLGGERADAPRTVIGAFPWQWRSQESQDVP